MTKKNKNIVKLTKLLEHWAEHNDSHKDSFVKWRDIAQEEGLEEVVKNLELAIKSIDESTKYLLNARKQIG